MTPDAYLTAKRLYQQVTQLQQIRAKLQDAQNRGKDIMLYVHPQDQNTIVLPERYIEKFIEIVDQDLATIEKQIEAL